MKRILKDYLVELLKEKTNCSVTIREEYSFIDNLIEVDLLDDYFVTYGWKINDFLFQFFKIKTTMFGNYYIINSDPFFNKYYIRKIK